MQSNPRGLLIAIEGIDGSGKSTLAHNLADKLKQKSFSTVLTKEPGDSQLGARIRTIVQKQDIPICPKAEFLLFAADRAQHFEELVEPKIAQHAIVISDRMADSSIVYQGFGRGLDIDMIKKINNWVMNDTTPDLVFYIRISPQEALKRLSARGTELSAFETKLAFTQKVLEGFEELYKDNKHVILLDGTQSPETITNQALNAVLACIQKLQK